MKRALAVLLASTLVAGVAAAQQPADGAGKGFAATDAANNAAADASTGALPVGDAETARAVKAGATAMASPTTTANAPAGPPPGYADDPRVLADQLVWGLVHGARLLGRACAQSGQGTAAEAWIRWQERELPVIRAVHAAVAGYFFPGEADAGAVSPEAVALMLGLRPVLDLPPEPLQLACDTLAEALAQPRYLLSQRRAELQEALQTPDGRDRLGKPAKPAKPTNPPDPDAPRPPPATE